MPSHPRPERNLERAVEIGCGYDGYNNLATLNFFENRYTEAAALFELKKRSQSRTTLRFENGIPRFVALEVSLPETLADDPVVKSLYFLGRYRDLYRLYEPQKQLYPFIQRLFEPSPQWRNRH